VDYSQLGRGGLKVSRLCIGTTNFGWQAPEPDAFAVMDRAFEAGINLIDTANTYGGPQQRGETERMIGRWFARGGGRREHTVVATKVFNTFTGRPNDGGLSKRSIRRSCEASLKRLNTDHIDLYQLHFHDPLTPWDEIWEAMELLRDQGKILYAGSANLLGWQIVTANEAAHEHRFALSAHQSEYNLVNRLVEHEILPACEHHGIGFLAYSPLQHGVLAGPPRADTEGNRRRTPKAEKVTARYAESLKAY
jgi:aryl-alcohol dehydrogenase-like predicted oxidoreductase